MPSPYGPFEYPVPRALGVEEIPALVELYAQAARNALEAGAFVVCV